MAEREREMTYKDVLLNPRPETARPAQDGTQIRPTGATSYVTLAFLRAHGLRWAPTSQKRREQFGWAFGCEVFRVLALGTANGVCSLLSAFAGRCQGPWRSMGGVAELEEGVG